MHKYRVRGKRFARKGRERRERSGDAIEATTDYILPGRYQKFIRSVILYLALTFQCVHFRVSRGERAGNGGGHKAVGSIKNYVA